MPWRRAWQPTPVFLPEESPRTEEPGGLQSMGSQSDMAGQLSTAHKRKCTNKKIKLLEQNIEEKFLQTA